MWVPKQAALKLKIGAEASRQAGTQHRNRRAEGLDAPRAERRAGGLSEFDDQTCLMATLVTLERAAVVIRLVRFNAGEPHRRFAIGAHRVVATLRWRHWKSRMRHAHLPIGAEQWSSPP